MATQQIDEYYESLAYWKQQAQDYEQALRDIEYNTIMNMTAEIEQLKAELRTSDLNRQSLWVDSLKLVDDISALKSKLKIAVEALEFYAETSNWKKHGALTTILNDTEFIQTIPNETTQPIGGARARIAISKIGGEI